MGRFYVPNPTGSTWDDLRQQLHVQYVGRFYVRPNDVKSPSVSWDSISYVAGFYVDWSDVKSSLVRCMQPIANVQTSGNLITAQGHFFFFFFLFIKVYAISA